MAPSTARALLASSLTRCIMSSNLTSGFSHKPPGCLPSFSIGIIVYGERASVDYRKPNEGDAPFLGITADGAGRVLIDGHARRHRHRRDAHPERR